MIAVDPCARCHSEPQMVQTGRYQVRCGCGACGPQANTAQEAVRRWRSVTNYMRQHQAYVGEMLQLAVHEESSMCRPLARFVRNR
jgi:hypothetical protein